MTKKISIPIMPVIIIVLAIIVVVMMLTRITKEEGSKLSKIYNKMIENQTYAFTRYNLEEKNKYIVYRKVDKTLIDMYNPGEHSSTLVSDNDTYLISHENEEYYIYPNNNLDEEILTDTLKEIIDLEYVVGKEKVYGKNYKYEEYKGVSEFLISAPINIDVNSIRTRFYFEGKNLVYLKTIYNTMDEETIEFEELQTVKVEYEVEDSVFKIPANYAEN